jgi:hypothetical protein
MSVDNAQILQIAHKKKAKVAEFLKGFSAGKAFKGLCRYYRSLDGYEPKVVKRGNWYMATVVFSASNWDNEKLKKRFDESYIVQVGAIDDRESVSNVSAGDAAEEEERASVFEFSFE